jgi:hypothetical protein
MKPMRFFTIHGGESRPSRRLRRPGELMAIQQGRSRGCTNGGARYTAYSARNQIRLDHPSAVPATPYLNGNRSKSESATNQPSEFVNARKFVEIRECRTAYLLVQCRSRNRKTSSAQTADPK